MRYQARLGRISDQQIKLWEAILNKNSEKSSFSG